METISVANNCVIAGGTKGIGRELVRLLQLDADQVDVYARGDAGLPESENVHFHMCDFYRDDVELAGLPDEVHSVAYCPGTINLRSFRSLKPDDFRADLELNLLGAVKFLQQCLPALKRASTERPSSVVLFSTVAVAQGMPMHASVAAAKGAVEGLVRSLAAEWAPDIRVNCIAPALTDTPLAARFFKTDESRKAMAEKYPLARTGTATDIAAAARFVLSDEAGWMTGQVLGVDGGMSSLRA